MNRCLHTLCTALALSVAAGAQGQVVIASLDATTLPINPANGFTGFTFGDFPPVGLLPQGGVLLFDITDVDTVNGVFGGAGVDFVDSIGEDELSHSANEGPVRELNPGPLAP